MIYKNQNSIFNIRNLSVEEMSLVGGADLKNGVLLSWIHYGFKKGTQLFIENYEEHFLETGHAPE